MLYRYELFRGDTRLGTIDHSEDDFPWHLGTYDPAHAFEEIKALFERQAELLPRSSESGEWRAARNDLDGPGLRLVDANGRTGAGNPPLHIRDRQVWWR